MNKSFRVPGEIPVGEEGHDSAALALLAAYHLGREIVQHLAVGHYHAGIIADGNSAANA